MRAGWYILLFLAFLYGGKTEEKGVLISEVCIRVMVTRRWCF